MDIDERLERLKQRHDALLLRLQREAEKRPEQDRRMAQLDARIDRLLRDQQQRIERLEG
ncbi:MAG: hypothetical protein ACRD19_13925 [Terriglobia bacterium]